MTHGSVFSGIGGPEVAATMLGWQNLFHCEINPFGRQVLDYWYPNAESYEDITKTDFSKWRGRINVLTGGFPCQPFSYAGQRRGAEDDRYLWPFMFRCIDQIRPDWVVAENVAGITTMVEQGEVSKMASEATLFGEDDGIHRYRLRETFTLQRICDDLESHGYSVQPILIPAASVGAPHRRDRVFIIGRIADTKCERLLSSEHKQRPRPEERLSERCGGRYVGEGIAPTDSACSGEGTPRTSGSTESGRGNANQQPSEWGTTSEWSDRFYAILRHAANTKSIGQLDRDRQERRAVSGRPHLEETERSVNEAVSNGKSGYVADTNSERLERHGGQELQGTEEWRRAYEYFASGGSDGIAGVGRWESFPSVSPVHRGNDGLPFDVDRLTIPFGRWRTEALKAYGNAICVQVMYEIFRAIDIIETP